MTSTLTWSLLGPEATHKCLTALDVPSIRTCLREIDSELGGKLLHGSTLTQKQVDIIADLFSHLVMFAKSALMTPEKASSLLSIVHTVHFRSMEERCTRVASYDILRKLIITHSVCRPPYGAAIFTLADVQSIDEYMLRSYYRFYKMYYYAFVANETLRLQTVSLGALEDIPPVDLPPLQEALPVEEWEKKVEEQERAKEEAQMEAEEKLSQLCEEERARKANLNDPQYTEGVKEQLQTIRTAVTQRSMSRLDVIEEKLSAIEAKVNDTRPGSKASIAKKR